MRYYTGGYLCPDRMPNDLLQKYIGDSKIKEKNIVAVSAWDPSSDKPAKYGLFCPNGFRKKSGALFIQYYLFDRRFHLNNDRIEQIIYFGLWKNINLYIFYQLTYSDYICCLKNVPNDNWGI